MTDLRRARADLARAAEDRTREELELQRLRANLARLDAAIADAQRTADATRVAAIRAERSATEATLRAASTRVSSARDAADRLHTTLLVDADPRRLATQLDDHTPFLLVPLRLETRWVGNELLIRAFPDEIAISSHEPALTDDEITRGKAFWTEAWTADEAATDAAWQRLLAGGAADRAVWIARTLRPTNAPPAAPQFPPVASKAASWTTAPHTSVLPDKLVFTLYAGESIAHQVVGAPIPSPLAVGPDPTAEIVRDTDGRLVVDEAMRWIVDFERAVAVGLAVRIPVSAAERTHGFDRLAVLGIRLTTDPAQNAAAVEALLDAHHYGDGLQLLPQGTPTNHTEAIAAGAATESPKELFTRELGAALFETEASDRSDGQLLARALGIDPAALSHVRNADRRDIGEAQALNRALWPATLGYFAEQTLGAKVSSVMRDEVRDLFTGFVTGRGCLPAIRAGRQPYGVLATTAFSRWQPMPGEPAAQASIVKVLDKLAETWRGLAANVARAGTGNDPEKTLLDVLGLQASSVAFDQRRAVGPEYLWNVATFAGVDAAARRTAHGVFAEQLLQSIGHDLRGARALDLEFVREVFAVTRPLVDTQPLSEIKALDPNYIEWLRGSFEAVRNESYGAPTPSALLYVMLRHAILLGAWDASTKLLIAHGLADESIRVEAEIVHVRAANEVTRWDHLDAKIPNVTGARAVVDFVRSPSAGDAASHFRDQLAALEVLAPLPTARLERLFAEHLDLCSYRLDAWRLGVVARRLDTLRAGDSRGIHLGAYGWLEQIRPRSPVPSGGFVHAPSPTHAVTAAILRAAYVTHTDPSARERMSIDLRSSRVRRALAYADGLQQGHELAALLGFHFERGLHDNNPTLGLEQHLVALRAAFPLVAGRVHDTAPGERIDHIEARNVVDGVRLLEKRPHGYPYGASGLPDATSTAGKAIIAEVDALAGDMDALADLVLAETVHQASQGKHERANAVATGLARGMLPSRFEVVETPRGGLAITHRVCLLLPTTGGTSLWNGSTPRGRFEPALDHWLGRLLGSPSTIRIRARHADGTFEIGADELGLQPIDLVLASEGDPRRLPASVRARIEAISRASLAADVRVEVDWAERSSRPGARTLFELAPLMTALYSILQSRPATAADLAADDAAPRQDVAELRARLESALADLRSNGSDWSFTLAGGNLEQVATAVEAKLLASAGSAKPLEELRTAAKLLFGESFNALPRFAPANASELASSLGSPALLAAAPPLAVEQWLAGIGRIRPALAAYENVHLLAQLPEPRIAQLPHDPAARWVGLELADATPRDGRALSLVLQIDAGVDMTRPLVGVVIDELTEVVPSSDEVTAVAFQADRPASEPPQALLLVVPASVGDGWQWSDLQQAIVETFELAKQRGVEPDAVAKTAYAQVLPAVLAPVAPRFATLVAEMGTLE